MGKTLSMGKRSKVLIAGIGNELRGDDGLGPAVIDELLKHPPPPDTDVLNFGERLYELLLQLKDYETAIIVDALDLGGNPGQIYVIEYGARKDEEGLAALNPHEANLRNVLSIGRRLGVLPKKVYIVGCQPGDISDKIGLSAVVKCRIDEIIHLIEKILVDYT